MGQQFLPLGPIPKIEDAWPLTISSMQGSEHGVSQEGCKVVDGRWPQAHLFQGGQGTERALNDHAYPTFAVSTGGRIEEEIGFEDCLRQGQAAQSRLDEGR